jgi:hypothetical protein
MDCEQALTLISSRIDREILPSENAWLSEHLRECAACRATAEAFALQHAELKDTFAPRRTAVGATVDRVNAAVADSRRGGPRRRRVKVPRKVWIGAAAVAGWVAAAVILYAVLSWHAGPPVSPPSPMPPWSGPPQGPQAKAEWLTPRDLPKAARPAPLPEGDKVETARGERRRATLPNGSAVFLNENTAVLVRSSAEVRVDHGTAFFDFTTESAQALPGFSSVVVTTPDRTLVGSGTKFAVTCEEQRTRLLVAEGNVLVTSASASPGEVGVVVRGGEQLAADADAATPSRRVSHLLDWAQDLMAEHAALVPASSYDGGALIAVDANGQEAKLSLRKYHVDVHLEDGFARTTIDQTYFNHHPWRLEGTFYFPLPPDASLSRLAMYVDGERMEGGMVERDYGRSVYERVVNGQRDPALLEWVDGSTFKMRVFPLEGRQEKRIILSYTQRVPTLYGRSQYRFPAGHSLQVVRDWSFHALVKNGASYAAASPTHPGMIPSKSGGDLALDDRAENCKVDRDVVLNLTDPSFVAEDKDVAHFSRAELDGNEYLMLRYRPQLTSQKARERRDWIFLYETSADRDPLLARTQIEVIRGLLQNVEREDTFRIVAASNRVHRFPDYSVGAVGIAPAPGAPGAGVGPPPGGAPGGTASVAAEEVAGAVQFLERTHLVGALDLGEAFRTVGEYARVADNPYLVHVGGGYTGMGTPQDELAKLLPPKAHYVGVGVGKRWNRAFMKRCAEQTGGYYTQINPDEPVSWRTFDLMATLNTPRLLGVEVADAREPQDAGEVRLRFLLDGNAVAQGEELCAVARLATRDGTDGWRKLAVPRELIVTGLLDGQKFRRTVRVEVEKVTDNAGYVPRTWARLEIDRLLTDNPRENRREIVELSKATYVMSPFTSLLVLENEAMYKEFKVDRGRKDHWAMYNCPQKIDVVYEPDPTMPADVRNAPKGMKPAASEVLQTVRVRVPPRWLEQADQGSRGRRLDLERVVEQTPAVVDDDSDRFYAGDFREKRKSLSNGRVGGVTFSPDGTLTGHQLQFGLRQLWAESEHLEQIKTADETPRDLALIVPDRTVRMNLRENNPRIVDAPRALPPTTSNPITNSEPPIQFPAPVGLHRVKNLGVGRVPPLPDLRLTATYDLNGIVSRLDNLDVNQIRGPEEASFRNWATGMSGEIGFDHSPGGDSLLFHRLRYSGDPRLFTDLLAYAPGLNTTEADTLAVLDAEALPELREAPGTIDREARELIEASRTAKWRKLTLGGEKGQPEQVVLFDGAGRYRYERTPAVGLHEIVTCDGETLLHQYPEIGLAARRAVTRFHRAEMSDLLPWVLPPAEDLARGVDLECVNKTTVALVPHWLRDAGKKDEAPKYVCLHLVFNDQKKLAERRLVHMPDRKTVASEKYDGKGGVRRYDDQGKEVESARLTLKVADADAPDLRPDLSGLVVVPLPYRSRDHAMRALALNPSAPLDADVNGCFEYLEGDDRVTLLAALAAGGHADEARLLFRRCFAERGDTRRGLFTLLAAAGNDVSADPAFQERFEKEPGDGLLQYLALCGNRLYKSVQQRLPLNRARSAETGRSFLRELADAQALLLRWESRSGRRVAWDRHAGDVERALAFLKRHPRDVLGQALLYQMQDRSEGRTDASEERRWGTLAAEWQRVADANEDAYRPRYEQASSLKRAGKRGEAAAVFKTLYERTLEKKVLPPIDRRFKEALQDLDDNHDVDDWNPLILENGRTLIKGRKYGTTVAMARQCWEIGERALAETLLTELLAAARGDANGNETTRAVIEFYAGTEQFARADALLQPLLADPKQSQDSTLWRAASRLAEQRGMETKAVADLEKALDLEYQNLPDVIDLRAWRADYAKLLDHYRKLAEGARTLKAAPPPELSARTLRAADRWRAHDPEASDACRKAAETFALLGEADLAWDYYTTTMIGRGTEASPWQGIAAELNQQGAYELADQALAVAAEADPTNAEVLWQKAKNLRQAGRGAEADRLMRRLADEKWPARYQDIRAHAQYEVKQR